MQYHPSEPRPYRRRGQLHAGRWEIDIRGTFDNGVKVERERRVFPLNPSAGKIGKRQAAAMANEEFERWNRYGQVLRPGETPLLERTGGMAPGAVPTVAQFAQDYLDFCRSPNATRRGANSPSTLQSKQIALRLHLLPAFGSMRLDQIHRRDVDHYIMSKSKKDRSINTISQDVYILRQMMGLARDHDLITHVPVFQMPACTPSEIVALDPDEIQRFLDVTSKLSLRNSTLLELYLRTGMRRGEALALRPCDFDLNAEQAVVNVSRTYSKGRFGATKGRNIRLIPIVPTLAEKLDELFRELRLSPRSTTEYPFSAWGDHRKPLSSMFVYRMVIATGEAANTRHLHPHMLRHTFGTDCARRGVPVLTIKEWMGHSKIERTMGYLHLVTPDHLRWAKLLVD